MGKEPKQNRLVYAKLASLDDLARYACNFDYTASSLICVRKPSGYAIFALGEQLDGSTLALYVNSAQSEGMLCYTYPSYGGQPENTHFVTAAGQMPNHYMGILEMESAGIKEAKKAKPVLAVRIRSPDELVKAVIRKGVATESIPHIYAFSKEGKVVLCAFDIISEFQEGPRTVYYAVSDRMPAASFARYKYTENKVDFTTYVGEHSYMYAKIINLAEPFSFFNARIAQW